MTLLLKVEQQKKIVNKQSGCHANWGETFKVQSFPPKFANLSPVGPFSVF